jgi:polar amino acid transport system ATP-binding protein
MEFAGSVAHRAIFLHQGRIEEEGAVADVFGSTKSARLRQFLNASSHML